MSCGFGGPDGELAFSVEKAQCAYVLHSGRPNLRGGHGRLESHRRVGRARPQLRLQTLHRCPILKVVVRRGMSSRVLWRTAAGRLRAIPSSPITGLRSTATTTFSGYLSEAHSH